jgi:hypothetical protein
MVGLLFGDAVSSGRCCLASSVAGKAEALYQNWGKCQESVVGVLIKGVFVSITHFRERARRGRLTMYHFYLSPASKRLAHPSHIFQVIYSHSLNYLKVDLHEFDFT